MSGPTRAPPRRFPASPPPPAPLSSENVKIYTQDEVQSMRARKGIQRDNRSFICIDNEQFLEQLKREESLGELNTNTSQASDGTERDSPPSRGLSNRPRAAPRGRGRGRGKPRGGPPNAVIRLASSAANVPTSDSPTAFKPAIIKSKTVPVVKGAPKRPFASVPPPPPGFDYIPTLGYFVKVGTPISSKISGNFGIQPSNSTPSKRVSMKPPVRQESPSKLDNTPRSISVKNVKSMAMGGSLSPKLKAKSFPARNTSNSLTELLDTERDYVNDMKTVVVEIYLQEIRKKKLLNKFEIVSIFSNIETIVEVNQKLLKELQQPNPNIGDIFYRFAADIKRPYAIYCSNQPNVRDTLMGYKEQSEELTRFMKSCFKRPESRKLDLESFLIMPLQRLCKYPLLLKEIQKTQAPDCPVMQSALDEIRSVVDDVNNRVRQVENLVKLMSVSNKITNGGLWPIIDQTRQYYMEGDISLSGKKKYGFLFDDALLLCEQDGKGDEKLLTAFRMLPLSLCVITDLPGNEEFKYQFELVEIGKDPKLIITFPTALKKKKWMKALDNFIKQNSGSTNEAKRESVAQIKAVVAPSVPASKPKKKSKTATARKETLKSDAVQNNPKIIALRQQIAKERKLREEAENYSEKLKQSLLSYQNNESKQQQVMEMQSKIGKLCGVVGNLTGANAELQQKLEFYEKEILLLAGI